MLSCCSATRPYAMRGRKIACSNDRARMPSKPVYVSCNRPTTRAHGLGDNAVDGWLDLTQLVASSGNSKKSAYDDLAYSIGRDVYVDLSGWHLFLRDMTATPGLKMNHALAQKLGPQAAMSERDIEAVLRQVPVKLGAGKMQVSLYDIMPSMCIGDLTKLCEENARR